jgi:glycosyltransferase involved in cell wall biosynthesis
VLLHPSKEEGGATAIVEALQSGTPVIASDCAGNVGLLGVDYPGLFPVGDVDAARALLLRAEGEPGFYRRLLAAARRRARLFTPAREGKSLRRLVHNSLQHNPPRSR